MINVLYTGAFRFPEGDAAASRVYSVAKLFEDVGCTVSFAGWESTKPGQIRYRYKGHDCFPQSEFREEPRSSLGRLIGFLFRGWKTLKWLAGRRQFDIVVAYNPPALFALALLGLGKLRGSVVVLDSTEWYESEHLVGGQFGLAAGENWLRMRAVYRLFHHVICISNYLECYFSGRNVIKILPLTEDVDVPSAKSQMDSGISFVYAGDAGKKDRLLPFVCALPAIRETLQRTVLLRIAGMDWSAMQALLLTHGVNPDVYASLVECRGRISRDAVAALYEQSHFSILFREDKRYARAGFPTKAMESWSHGCPIVTNRVGDIGALAQDGIDSIVVDERNIAAVVPVALQRIIESNQYSAMSTSCRAKARQIFSQRAYLQDFETFIRRMHLPRHLGA